MNLSTLPTLALAAGILCASAAPASAITNGTRPADDDFRFDAVGALSNGHFLGLDPDHPNAFDHNWWCTATLITPEIALTAAHCITDPWAEGIHAVRFRRHTDGSLGTKAEGPESFHHAWVDHFEELPGDALGSWWA